MEAYRTYRAALKAGFDQESDRFEKILQHELCKSKPILSSYVGYSDTYE